jgi:hypothetical protein
LPSAGKFLGLLLSACPALRRFPDHIDAHLGTLFMVSVAWTLSKAARR